MSTELIDWLDTVPAHDGVPRKELVANPRYQELVQAFACLTPAQRTFVRALPAAHYVPLQAVKALKAAGMKISDRTAYRWMSDSHVKRAIDVYRALAGEFAGVDALSVMLRVSDWARYCAEEVPELDSEGNQTGRTRRRDAANGLKALELLGKHTKALGADSGPVARQLPAFAVIVNAAQPASAGAVIDSTAIAKE